MDKVIEIYNLVIKFVSSPQFLRVSLLVVFSLVVIYNGFLFLKKYKSKSGVDAERITVGLLGKFKHFSKKIEHFILQKKVSVILNFFFGVLFLASLLGLSIPTPLVTSPTDPALGIAEVTDEKPLVIEFDRPIKKSIEHNITPELKGDWGSSGSLFSEKNTLTFIPKEAPKAETRYTVSITRIKNIFGFDEAEYLFSFQAPPAPKISSVVPGDGDQGVLPGQEIVIVTDYPHDHTAEFSFEVSPETELEVKKDDKTYIIKPKDKFRKSTDYSLKIYRTLISYNYETKEKSPLEEKKEAWSGSFRTVEAPSVNSYTPTGSGVLVNTPVRVEFKQDMDRVATEKAFSVNPNVSGSFSWESDRLLVFTPSQDIIKNTKYTVNISIEALAKDGSPFEEAFSYDFTTIGYVKVSSFSPGNGATGVGLTSVVKVAFNQVIDHGSAESKFSISPDPGGTFSWSGNTLIYNHNAFSYVTGYTMSVASGVKTVYGLDSNQTFSATFTTQSQSVTLSVPSYPQSHMYSCMASAARQALAYRGVYLSENTILSNIGYDYTPFSGVWGDPNAVWGNPNAGVTGDIDGASGGVNWGYGAHAGPTASAISLYRPTEVKSGWNVQGIAQEIANGNPVIVWWVNGVWPAYAVSWKTSGGTTINGVNSMHVQVVKGFTGTVDNPTSFIVNDSGYGYPARTFDVGTFKAKWSWFGNSAVVVK